MIVSGLVSCCFMADETSLISTAVKARIRCFDRIFSSIYSTLQCSMYNLDYDIIVAGGGKAGTAAAVSLTLSVKVNKNGK